MKIAQALIHPDVGGTNSITNPFCYGIFQASKMRNVVQFTLQ